MSTFSVPVVRVKAIEPIPGADAIELAVVGEYRSVVRKGDYKPGDLVVYLPEGAMLPDWLIEKIGLTGKLAGREKNRIRAVRLRGCLSQGILLKPHSSDDNRKIVELKKETGEYSLYTEGYDVASVLGITKYEPEIPARMAGECASLFGYTVPYDIENWKKYPDTITEGEEVFITEKLHGTMCCFAYYPGLNHPEFPDDVFVYSKGLGAKGLVFKWNEKNANNLYLRAYHDTKVGKKTPIGKTLALHFPTTPVFIFGEVVGKGVQDLTYGMTNPTFRAFDMWVGTPSEGGFVDAGMKYMHFDNLYIPHVPVLYQGPFSREVLLSLTDGKTALGEANIREGVVITPPIERRDPNLGRVVLKNVSGDYLTRKGGSEFN